MKPEPKQWDFLSVIREVGTALIKCDCVSLEKLAQHCGTLTDGMSIDGPLVSDPKGNFAEGNLQSPRHVAAGQLELLGLLLESTRGTLQTLGQSGLMRSAQIEYRPGVGQGE
jgi:hypothetical protein